MQQDKEQVALTSIAASTALTVAKGVVGVLTGSLARESNGINSLLRLPVPPKPPGRYASRHPRRE